MQDEREPSPTPLEEPPGLGQKAGGDRGGPSLETENPVLGPGAPAVIGSALEQGHGDLGIQDREGRDAGEPGQGGGTYGQHDRVRSARRSENREAQHYDTLHQGQPEAGYSGYTPANPDKKAPDR